MKFLSDPSKYELIHKPFALPGNLLGPCFTYQIDVFDLETTLSAGFAILNNPKPTRSHPFTLRGIALKIPITSKADANRVQEYKADAYPVGREGA